MDDFTKIKLINSLIDVVDRFYTLKDEREFEESLRLKGFCEGLSYALIQMGALDSKEAEVIMNGLGKRLSMKDIKQPQTPPPVNPKVDITESTMLNELKKEAKELKIDTSTLHSSLISKSKDKEKDLDLPTFLRKRKN
ncbi:MAG: hypothetical protein DSZ06_02330 [Sulfurospirillum sp.]|nr:MAG: hypothetical protein DSZ06_02330 [Sulfurospirillum sp.]